MTKSITSTIALIVCTFVLGLQALADSPSYSRQTADFGLPASRDQWTISMRQGQEGLILPIDFIYGQSSGTNVPLDMSGWTVELALRKPSGVDAARLSGTNLGTSAEFTMTSDFLAQAVEDWRLILQLQAGTQVVNQAAGTLSIVGAPELDSGTLVLTRNINLGLYTWTPTGNNGQFLASDGTGGVTWSDAGCGTVTNITGSGLVEVTGGPIEFDVGVSTAAVNNAEADAIALADLATHTNLALSAGAHGGELDPVAGAAITAHIANPSDAHAASAVSQTNTPMGVTVQDALDYANTLLDLLDSTKVDKTGNDDLTGDLEWPVVADSAFLSLGDGGLQARPNSNDDTMTLDVRRGVGAFRTASLYYSKDGDTLAGIILRSTSGTTLGGDNGTIVIGTNGTITASQPISGEDPTLPVHLVTKSYGDANYGDVTKVGTPIDNQVGVWTGDGTLEGAGGLTWDGTTMVVEGLARIADEAAGNTTTAQLFVHATGAGSDAFVRMRTIDGPYQLAFGVQSTTGSLVINMGNSNLAGDDFKLTQAGDLSIANTITTGNYVGSSSTQIGLSTDPADPAAGNSVQWVSDGTGSGDAGDVMIKINVASTVKTITLVDYSAF